MSEHTSGSRRSDQGNCVEHCGRTLHSQTLAGDGIAVTHAGRAVPAELMGGSSRIVMTSNRTSQILEQIGTGAEARTTSGNSAICETCAGEQIENVARPDDRRIDSGGTPQERNPAEVRGHDLEQDRNGSVHVRVTDEVAETGATTPERRT